MYSGDASKLRPSTAASNVREDVPPRMGESNIVTLTRRYSGVKGKWHGYNAAYRSEFRRAAHAHIPRAKFILNSPKAAKPLSRKA